MQVAQLIKLLNDTKISHHLASAACEDIFEWRKWMKEIPFIKFPAHWKVQMIPPHACAIVRFRVANPNREGEYISVFLDGYNHMGVYWDKDYRPLPYWEIYPSAGGEVERFDMNNIAELLAGIEKAFAYVPAAIEDEDFPDID